MTAPFGEAACCTSLYQLPFMIILHVYVGLSVLLPYIVYQVFITKDDAR
jgi:hypothetical protein